MIKNILKPLIPQSLLNMLDRRKQKIEFEEWEKNGYSFPPPHLIKQRTISEYREKYKYSVLVETGTAFGNMVEAQKKKFKRIFSIELGVDLFEKAKKRFKNDENVTII